MIIRLIFILLCGSCLGQQLSDDLEKISSKIGKELEITISVKATVRTHESGSVLYQATSQMLRSQELGTLVVMDGHRVYENANYQVQVNPDDKTVFVHKVKHYDPNDFSEKLLKDVRKYFEAEAEDERIEFTEKLVSDNGGVRVYSLKKLPGLKEMKIELDMNRLSIRKVEYWFSETNSQAAYYCQVVYDTFNYELKDKSPLVQATYFLLDADGTIRLASGYKNYKLLAE